MSYTVENLEKNKVKIVVKVDQKDWQDAIQKAYEKPKKTISWEVSEKDTFRLRCWQIPMAWVFSLKTLWI